eukprot:Rmarinus@m.16671
MGGVFSQQDDDYPPISEEKVEEIKVLSPLSHNDVIALWKRFKLLDSDNTDTITVDEFLKFPELRLNPLIERIIPQLDINKDGVVTFRDFCVALSVFSPEASGEHKQRLAFKIYDVDGDGKISKEDLEDVLRMQMGSAIDDDLLEIVVERTFDEADSDQDGFLSFEDFQFVVANTDLMSKMTIYWE